LPPRDTVKLTDRRGEPDTETGEILVRETLPRERIVLVQTPQAFSRAVLADALRFADDATDEASLAERAGHSVVVVAGEEANIKTTTSEDLPQAETIAARLDGRPEGSRRATSPVRTGRAGTGYDLHRLVEGRPLVLGGVIIPFERGALGHSDA